MLTLKINYTNGDYTMFIENKEIEKGQKYKHKNTGTKYIVKTNYFGELILGFEKEMESVLSQPEFKITKNRLNKLQLI